MIERLTASIAHAAVDGSRGPIDAARVAVLHEHLPPTKPTVQQHFLQRRRLLHATSSTTSSGLSVSGQWRHCSTGLDHSRVLEGSRTERQQHHSQQRATDHFHGHRQPRHEVHAGEGEEENRGNEDQEEAPDSRGWVGAGHKQAIAPEATAAGPYVEQSETEGRDGRVGRCGRSNSGCSCRRRRVRSGSELTCELGRGWTSGSSSSGWREHAVLPSHSPASRQRSSCILGGGERWRRRGGGGKSGRSKRASSGRQAVAMSWKRECVVVVVLLRWRRRGRQSVVSRRYELSGRTRGAKGGQMVRRHEGCTIVVDDGGRDCSGSRDSDSLIALPSVFRWPLLLLIVDGVLVVAVSSSRC